MSGRRGPVVLHAPRDLFSAEVDPPVALPVACAAPGAPTADQLAAIMTMLEGASEISSAFR